MSKRQSLLIALAIVFFLGCESCEPSVRTIRLNDRVFEVRTKRGCAGSDVNGQAVEIAEYGADQACPDGWVITDLSAERTSCYGFSGVSAIVECKER